MRKEPEKQLPMNKTPLTDLVQFIKQGEKAKEEFERRFEVKWEDVEKRGDNQ